MVANDDDDQTPAIQDGVLEGSVTYTAEFLRKNAKKRKELLAAPDDTPGKDVAVQVEAAAPIIRDAVTAAKKWQELHGKAAVVTRALAENLVQLRLIYTDSKGNPDLRGSSNAYREAAAQIYLNAGFDEDTTEKIRGAARWHTSDVVREVLKTDERFANGSTAKYRKLCKYYGLNPQSAVEKQRDKRDNARQDTRLPALVMSADDPAGMYFGAVRYAHRALDAPIGGIPDNLPDDQRAELRDELTAVRDRADALLESLDEE